MMLPNIPSVRAETESAGALKAPGRIPSDFCLDAHFKTRLQKEFSREHENFKY
jgi:hypothetical protein